MSYQRAVGGYTPHLGVWQNGALQMEKRLGYTNLAWTASMRVFSLLLLLDSRLCTHK